MASAAAEPLTIDGHPVTVTHPEKVLYAGRGTTKRDLIDYYLSLREPVLRAMGGRPVLLQRFPRGAGSSSFFQKRVPKGAPDWLETTVVSTPNGTTSNAMVVADMAHVAWAVNLGCLGFHVWPYRAADQDPPDHDGREGVRADELRLDLDPQPGTGFDEARAAAWVLKDLLDEVGLDGYPKTTGRKGVHVFVRLTPGYDSYQVRAAAVAVARELERRRPDLLTAAWWKEERGARVLLDFNQNAPHKTVFGAWSVRDTAAATVSTPLRWDDLDDVDPRDLTIDTVPAMVAERGDPWEGIDAQHARLDPLLDMSRRDLDAGLMDAPWPPQYPKQPGEPMRVAPSRAASHDEGEA